MAKTTPLPNKLQQALADLHQAEKLAGDMATTKSNQSVLPDQKYLSEIKNHMQKPEWKMRTKNRLTGGVKQQVFMVEMEVEFMLDTKTLIEAIDKYKNLKSSDIEAYKRVIKDKDPELSEIVLDSLLPHAFGISTSAKILEKQTIVNDSLLESVTEREWPVTMKVMEGLVHFDYVDMLNGLIGVIRQIDKDKFEEEVWVHTAAFRGEDDFLRSFHWDEGDVIVSVEAGFERLE